MRNRHKVIAALAAGAVIAGVGAGIAAAHPNGGPAPQVPTVQGPNNGPVDLPVIAELAKEDGHELLDRRHGDIPLHSDDRGDTRRSQPRRPGTGSNSRSRTTADGCR